MTSTLLQLVKMLNLKLTHHMPKVSTKQNTTEGTITIRDNNPFIVTTPDNNI